MKLFFKQLELPFQSQILASWLAHENWPFHVNQKLGIEKVLEMIEAGTFSGTNHRTFWIEDDTGRKVGIVRLFDLDDIDDGYPMFDLRIRNDDRGKGVGAGAVQWLTKYLFEEWPQLDRIAGTTRADNIAMRKTFKKCGYIKEGHYRKDWRDQTGKVFDTVRYGILREDWESGATTPVVWFDE
jgi:RimJ/RimL family protein N-acetyltransferase